MLSAEFQRDYHFPPSVAKLEKLLVLLKGREKGKKKKSLLFSFCGVFSLAKRKSKLGFATASYFGFDL